MLKYVRLILSWWRSGNASVCKTDTRGFDSPPGLLSGFSCTTVHVSMSPGSAVPTHGTWGIERRSDVSSADETASRGRGNRERRRAIICDRFPQPAGVMEW